MNLLFAAGLILLALAAVADFAGGRFMRSGPLYLLGAAGSACLAVLGGFALAGRLVLLDVAGWLGDPVPGQQAAALAADRLSGMFLALTFGAAVPVSVAFASWARSIRGDDPRSAPRGTTPPNPPEAPAHGGLPAPPYPPGAGRELCACARRGRGDHDRAGRVHCAVRLGDAHARLLPARRLRTEQTGPGRRRPGHVRVRQGQRGRAADRPAAPGDQVALDHAGLVHPCPGRRGPHHRRGAASRRLRGQGRPGSVPGLAAARLLGRARARPGDHGRGLRERRLLRHVAHAGPDRPCPRLADRRAAGARRAERAARHRPRGGAEPAVPGDRLLQHREHRTHRHRLRRGADRRGDRGPAPGRGRAAGRHVAGGRAHRGQVAPVHLRRWDRGRNWPR